MSLKKSKSNFGSTKLKKLRKPVAKSQIVARKPDSDESDSSENILSDEENQWKDTKRTVSDPSPDYHNIQKLVKYVKAGNTTATIVSLCCLKDYDLSISTNQLVRICSFWNIDALFLFSFYFVSSSYYSTLFHSNLTFDTISFRTIDFYLLFFFYPFS